MKLGYIQKINLEMNPHLTERFKFKETTFTRRITSKGERIYSKMFHPLDYEDVVSNTNIMKRNSKIILVGEPFILDDELKEKVVKWVEWVNNADPKEYDPFA